jgi:hypothetical protein
MKLVAFRMARLLRKMEKFQSQAKVQNKAFLRVIQLNTTRDSLFLVILSNGKPLWSIPCPALSTLADNDIDM